MPRCLVLFCLSGALLAAGCAPAGRFYALSRADNTLHLIRTEPASTVRVGHLSPLPPKADLSELASAGDGQAFTIDRASNRLIRLRLSDGAVVGSVPLDQDVWVTRRGIDVAPDGTLWAVLPGLQLRTIDPSTGRSTLIAPITGATIVEAIAFSAAGTLYAVGESGVEFSRRLYTINTETGAATPIAALPVSDLDTLAWADGFLYAADSSGSAAELYRIEPDTGELTVVCGTGIVELNGLLAVPRRERGKTRGLRGTDSTCVRPASAE
jgi:hypothetical protein